MILMAIPWLDACSGYWCARRVRRDGTSRAQQTAGESWVFSTRRISRPRKHSMMSFAASSNAAGAEVLHLPAAPDPSLDAVYTHDPSLASDSALIGLHPGKPNRIPEAQRHLEFCRSLGIPVLGRNPPTGKN